MDPAPELPTGTVTFLFTDIEGSTRLLQQLGDAYPDLLSRHHRLLRGAVEEAGGVAIGSEGDSLFAAFGSASAGLAAAVEAQRALAAEQWPGGASVRVRMGLHTGEALVRNLRRPRRPSRGPNRRRGSWRANPGLRIGASSGGTEPAIGRRTA